MNSSNDQRTNVRRRRTVLEQLSGFLPWRTETQSDTEARNSHSSSHTELPRKENAAAGDDEDDPLFACHICLDTAANPVVTLCGHLFCWPCLCSWLESPSPNANTCPVCKSGLSRDKVIPIFARGREPKDPRDMPQRPPPQRSDPPRSGWRSFFGPNVQFHAGFGLFPGFSFGVAMPANAPAFQATPEQLEVFQRISNAFSLVGFLMLLFVLLY